MRLSEQEVAMFEGLQKSALGPKLAEFLERLSDDLCDIRSMSSPTPESLQETMRLCEVLKSEVIDRIRLTNKKEHNPQRKI